MTSKKQIGLLPISRTVSYRNVLEIISDKEIQTKRCDRLGEYLIYFYYASLYYTLCKDGVALTEEEMFPVGILYEVQDENAIASIYCTDTGHFLKIKKIGEEPKGFELSDLRIGNSFENLRNFLQIVWQDNKTYLNTGNILNQKVIGTQYDKAFDYLFKKAKILNDRKFNDEPKGEPFDNRVLRTEVQIRRNIRLDEQLVFIVPENNLILFKKLLLEKKINAKVLPYSILDTLDSPEVKSRSINLAMVKYLREQYEKCF
ncbi:MAG: hypothetical protein ACXVAX_05220 [Pseudobdellovibrio sp.]